MNNPILLIEDTASMSMVYESALAKEGYSVITASTADEAYTHFEAARPSVVLLDLRLPDRDGLDLMRDCLQIDPKVHFVVLTANGSINRAVEAMRAGAREFLVKPFDERRLISAVAAASADAARLGAPDGNGTIQREPTGFIGSSDTMQRVYARIASVSRSMATAFISGESGTGKEVCAQAIHNQSSRASGPFVPLNCGAIPGDLLESEVFGHLKGSFTGAISDKLGAAQAADGGTLFLDEICEMDLNLQTKLLRFLQTSTVQPVGATKARKVNARIVCATNRDPLQEVRAGRFREDLYYRLHVVPIHLPPLRERGNDVIEIAETALKRYSREEGKEFVELSPKARLAFTGYSWPGNVRQVLNVLRNIVVLNDGPLVEVEMLPPELTAIKHCAANPQPSPLSPDAGLTDLVGRPLAEIEQTVIEATIRQAGGSIPRAARVLGVSPSTIYRKRESWRSLSDG